jgi:hypothetical protein
MRIVIIHLFLFLFCGYVALGQFEKPLKKKNFYFGGGTNLNFDNRVSDSFEYQRSMYSISPNIGYFILDRFAIGVKPFFSKTFSKLNSFSENDTFEFHSDQSSVRYSYGISPSVRYYLKNGIFFEADFDLSRNNDVTDNSSSLMRVMNIV